MRGRSCIFAALLIIAPFGAQATVQVVWWEKRFYPQEDEAVAEIVAAFEKVEAADNHQISFSLVDFVGVARSVGEAISALAEGIEDAVNAGMRIEDEVETRKSREAVEEISRFLISLIRHQNDAIRDLQIYTTVSAHDKEAGWRHVRHSLIEVTRSLGLLKNALERRSSDIRLDASDLISDLSYLLEEREQMIRYLLEADRNVYLRDRVILLDLVEQYTKIVCATIILKDNIIAYHGFLQELKDADGWSYRSVQDRRGCVRTE